MATNNPTSPDQRKVVTMARFIARRRVMDELKRNGLRFNSVEPEDISRAVQRYLDACKAELVAEAKSS